MISTEGNARALHFSPAPTGLRSGQFSRHSTDVCRASVETTPDRAAAAVKSGSTVFSVQQQQRAVSAAEEFCIQIHAIKLAIKPQQK